MIEHARNSEEYQQGLDYATDTWIHFLNNFATNTDRQFFNAKFANICLAISEL